MNDQRSRVHSASERPVCRGQSAPDARSIAPVDFERRAISANGHSSFVPLSPIEVEREKTQSITAEEEYQTLKQQDESNQSSNTTTTLTQSSSITIDFYRNNSTLLDNQGEMVETTSRDSIDDDVASDRSPMPTSDGVVSTKSDKQVFSVEEDEQAQALSTRKYSDNIKSEYLEDSAPVRPAPEPIQPTPVVVEETMLPLILPYTELEEIKQLSTTTQSSAGSHRQASGVQLTPEITPEPAMTSNNVEEKPLSEDTVIKDISVRDEIHISPQHLDQMKSVDNMPEDAIQKEEQTVDQFAKLTVDPTSTTGQENLTRITPPLPPPAPPSHYHQAPNSPLLDWPDAPDM